MTSLNSLTLSVEGALESYPALLPAFASLQSVRTLHVSSAGVRSCELVKTLQSQLVCAEIFATVTIPLDRHRLIPTDFHPIFLLERSALTLKSLTCGFWSEAIPELFTPPPNIVYPNLHHLSLHETQSSTLFPHMKVFPNVEHLAINHHHGRKWVEGLQDFFQSRREENMRLPGLSSTSIAWKHLQDYAGPLFDLWMLGLTCPIRQLFINDVHPARPPLALTDVLAYARPEDLTVVFRGCSLTDALGGDFLSALRSEGASGLKCLAVVVHLMAGSDDRDLDMGCALADIGATLSGLKLTNLIILIGDYAPYKETPAEGTLPATATATEELHVSGHHTLAPAEADTASDSSSATTSAGASSISRAALSLGERSLDELDVRAFTERLVKVIPTLEDALIGIDRPRRRGGAPRCAKVIRNPDVDVGVDMGRDPVPLILYREVTEDLPLEQVEMVRSWLESI